VIATAGAITSQKLTGQPLNPNSIFAYTAFGALVAGPFAHFFYELIGRIVPDVRFRRILEFLLERLTFAPIFCGLSLYFLTIFEGKTPDQATKNLFKLYKSVLLANWRYLTLPVFLNFNFTPPMLRVFVSNIIGFFWVIYMADKRRRAAAAAKKE
jgi:peroxisomal membrane protein 2